VCQFKVTGRQKFSENNVYFAKSFLLLAAVRASPWPIKRFSTKADFLLKLTASKCCVCLDRWTPAYDVDTGPHQSINQSINQSSLIQTYEVHLQWLFWIN